MTHTILEANRINRAQSTFGRHLKQPLMLGVFALNGSGSGGICTLPSSFEMTWAHNLKIAQMADAFGLELFMPLSRWIGFGGKSNYAGDTFEPLSYMAGIAASTKRIMTIVTLHVPFVHPVLIAKAISTIDHISNGRAGINMVMGWLKPELALFGLTPMATDDRYAYGAEWLSIVHKLWCEQEPFDHEGESFQLKGLISNPKPVQQRPPIVSAAMSDAGLAFACEHADLTFASFKGYEQLKTHCANLRAKAKEIGNPEVGVVSLSLVICRETEAEARAYHQSLRDHSDLEAAANFAACSGMDLSTLTEAERDKVLRDLAMNPGNATLIGTPTQVADQIEEMHVCGVSALFVGFHDYLQEFPFFHQNVMPLL